MVANIKKIWNRALQFESFGKTQKCQDELNKGLGLLGVLTIEGLVEIDGLKIDKWKNRFWNKLEEVGGMDIGEDGIECTEEELHEAFKMG